MTSEFTPWFTWVHLSDLHAGEGGASAASARKEVIDALGSDLALLRQHDTVPPVEVIGFTGDITQSACKSKPTEFDEAVTAVGEIVSRLDTVPDLLFVPGNHDCERLDSSDKDTERLLRSLRMGLERLDEVMERDQDRQRLIRRFDSAAPMTWQQTFHHPGGQIAFTGLNSAWLSQDQLDEGQLQLGRGQLTAQASDRSSINVVMMHHPLGWLRDHDEIAPSLAKHFDILMSGHLHVPVLTFDRIAGGKKTLRIGAGATWKPTEKQDAHGAVIWAPDDGHTYSVLVVGMGESGLAVRIFPRMWAKDTRRFVRDAARCDGENPFTQEALELPFASRSSPAHRLAVSRTDLDAVRASSMKALEEFGAAHTAFPTDLSLAELHDKHLVTPTRFESYEDSMDEAMVSSARLTDLVVRVQAGENLLVLGRPGSGKSVAMYEIAKALPSAVYVFPYRLSALRRTYSDWKMTQSRLASVKRAGAVCVFLLDGLDEASVTTGASPFDLKGVLSDLSGLGAVVVSCRTADFEQYLARLVADSIDFGSAWRLAPWRHDVEFSGFIENLRASGFTDETGLLQSIRDSSRLQALVSCPLYARMLTLVGSGRATEIADTSELYQLFFQRLAERTDVTLTEAGYQLAGSSLAIWQELAWITFRNGLMLDEALNMTAAVSLLEGYGDRAALERCLATIIDSHRSKDEGRFVHYSFFHFLLATGIEQLITAAPERIDDLRGVLSRDLPRPVRHFLVSRLKATKGALTLSALVQVYSRLRGASMDGGPSEETLVGCNLIAYMLSRAFGPLAEPPLRELLANESDDFVTNSLRWALSHIGALDIAAAFIENLENSATYSAMCRGYLLYYHGDLTREAHPPFLDDDPSIPWFRTRAAVLEIMGDEHYFEDVPLARVVVDLYSFLSFPLYRRELLRTQGCRLTKDVLQRLFTEPEVPDGLVMRLMSMHAAVCGFSVAD